MNDELNEIEELEPAPTASDALTGVLVVAVIVACIFAGFLS